MSWIKNTSKGIVLNILVQPRASKIEVVGPHGTPPRLKIRITAAPTDGQANEQILKFLKELLSIKNSEIQLLRGQTSKQKDFLIVSSLTVDEIKNTLLDN